MRTGRRFTWLMSGTKGFLSELRRELGLGPVQPDRHRVGGEAECGRDVTGRESLPRPEADDLLVDRAERTDRASERRITDEWRRFRLSLAGQPLDQAKRSRCRTGTVGDASSRDAVAPWERQVRGNVLEATPHDEQDIGHQVLDVVRAAPAAQVALQRLVHLGKHGIETVGARGRRLAAHVHPLSSTRPILSAVPILSYAGVASRQALDDPEDT